ncbi:MAG: hypothetical protein HFI31_16355, partial [Lachnospiraceae bacterium]|nr:hypothetical protein [Lachnospiraceae bacterium]
MNPYFPNLFRPMKVKNVVFKNRIFMSPTSLKILTDHDYLDYNSFDYFERRAEGGAAVITVGDVVVHETGAVKWSKKVKIYDDR